MLLQGEGVAALADAQLRLPRRNRLSIRIAVARAHKFNVDADAAGIWENWRAPAGSLLETVSILTTSPNKAMEGVHDRMPVILPPTSYELWLDPAMPFSPAVNALLQPFDAAQMQRRQVMEIDPLRERTLSAIIQTVTTKRTAPQVPAAHRKRNRDRRVAALSLDLVPAENQRAIRALNQALLAGELHDAMALCLQSNLLMPLAALLRSLIDTSVLGIWLLKYATDEEVRDSVAHVSAVDMVQRSFGPEDRSIFAFIFQPVKGTDHEFYRDVLHPSIHGDALHIAMRVRDQASKRTWVHKCLFHANHVYVHMLLQFAKSGKVPQEFQDYIREESAKAIRVISALLEHPDWKGTDEQLSE